MVPKTYGVDMWIDNTEVLSQDNTQKIKDGVKGHFVLDYDMWRVMNMLQEKIVTPLRWNKIDSNIEENVYAAGAKPDGDEFSIRLNIVVDQCAEEARKGVDSPPQLWYEKSQMMVQLDSGRMLYVDVSEQMSRETSKGGMIQYLMSKNLHWNGDIFNMIDWKGMETTLGKIKDTEVTNVLKMVHGWQKYGYQKYLFDEVGKEHFCPAGCGAQQARQHFLKCKAAALQSGHKERTGKFKKVQKGLKTAGLIYHSFLSMLQHLREESDPPSFVSYFESHMDNLVKEAWEEQKII